MAHNYLEQLVAEWYEYQGYFVRRNILVGKRDKGGHECELDVVAFNPETQHLVHVEPSMAPTPGLFVRPATQESSILAENTSPPCSRDMGRHRRSHDRGSRVSGTAKFESTWFRHVLSTDIIQILRQHDAGSCSNANLRK